MRVDDEGSPKVGLYLRTIFVHVPVQILAVYLFHAIYRRFCQALVAIE